MNLREEIEKYEPFNEQEASDKKEMLQLMDAFSDVLTRENTVGHFTTSAWLVNKERTKVLMIYHNIYRSWAWIGGHSDGIENLREVIKREIEEETGVKQVKFLTEDIYGLSAVTVNGHVKRGKYVSSHMHYDVEFLLEADEKETIRIKEDENSGVKWVPIEEVCKISNEKHMLAIYERLNNKLRKLIEEGAI